MKPRAPYIIICILAILVLGSASLVLWGYWQVYGIGGWRDELYASEGVVASGRALDDFRAGHLRLYTLGGENEHARYTGTNDGPFEIWVPHFYPSLGQPHRFRTAPLTRCSSRLIHHVKRHRK